MQDGDQRGDDGEAALQRHVGDPGHRDRGGDAARRRRDLEQHAETQVDQVEPDGPGRHGARRRDDGDEADRRGGLEVEAERCIEERDQEDAAAQAEQRPETSGDGSGAHHDGDDGGGEDWHGADAITTSSIPASAALSRVRKPRLGKSLHAEHAEGQRTRRGTDSAAGRRPA